MHTFQPGMKARTCVEIEVDGYEDDDIESGFTCLIQVGALVEVVSEPISSNDLFSGDEHVMIAIKATDTDGIQRTTLVDLEDLTIATLS